MAFYWLWTLLYVVGRCFNPTSGEVLSPELKDEVNMFVNDVLACRKISGLTLAVVKSEETWIKGYGKADMALDRAVDADTQFLIGSLTKAFTALAIGMLLKESTKGCVSLHIISSQTQWFNFIPFFSFNRLDIYNDIIFKAPGEHFCF